MARRTVFPAFPPALSRVAAAWATACGLVIAGPSLVGCSANVSASSEAADADSNASSSLAVIVVERSANEEPVHAEAVARFLRMRGAAVDGDALRMVGAVLDLPAAGSCALTTSLARPTGTTGSAARVELLDVGSLAVEANGVTTPLLPRRLPDVADLVSGVFYARAVDGDALPARARYVVRAHDGSALVSATAPADLAGLRIAASGASGLDVVWDAGTAEDLVYVDAASDEGTVRCVFPDAGRGLLPASAVGAATGLTVHRLHRESLRLPTGEAGELRFDFARPLALPRG